MDSWGIGPSESPLASDWSSFFQAPAPEVGWWKGQNQPYAYESGWQLGTGFDYHPGGSMGEMYDPQSSMGWRATVGTIDDFMMREHPELFDFSQNWQQGGVASVGTVAKDPSFGQFAKTPEVYAEMQAAAQKYGVPVNLLQAVIARESSGNWQANSVPVAVSSRGGKRIHGFVGIFEDAARAWGFDFNKGIGNRAYQIEMLAGGLRRFYDQLNAQNPQYGWSNAAAFHFSGTPGGNYVDELGNTTTGYTNDVVNWWKRLDQTAGNTWSNFTSAGQASGVASPMNTKWAPVNRYDNFVTSSAQKYGVPANLIKAVMQFESNGNPNARSQQGALGLMQIMPIHVNGNSAVLYDPMTNIDVGTRILMENYRRWGAWELAAKAYLAGNPYSTAFDALGTGVGKYWSEVKSNWDELNAAGSGMFGGAGGGSGGSSLPIAGIWGGGATNITQEFGPTAFSNGDGAWMYDYSIGLLGQRGHPGLDIGMPVGTNLFSPVAGTVIRSGGSGSFYNTEAQRYQSGTGELRIRLDNGHEVILGHMSRISVPVGSRVTAGQNVGVSGYPGGPHLHLEYRIPDTAMSSGWRAVDPRQYLTGGIIPGSHQTNTGLGSQYMPMTYKNLLLAGAKGMEIPQGATGAIGGGSNAWNSYIRQLMSGQVPYKTNYTFTYNMGGTPIGTDDHAGHTH